MICLTCFKAVILNDVNEGDLVGKRRLVQPGLLLGKRGAQVRRVEAHRLVGVSQVAVRGHELPGIVTLAVARFDIELLESNCLACLDAGDALEGYLHAAAALVSRKLHACFQGFTRSVLEGLAGLCVMECADDSIGLTNCNVFIGNRIDEIDGTCPHDGMRPVCGCERRAHARHVNRLRLVGDIGMHGELASLAGKRLEGDDCLACQAACVKGEFDRLCARGCLRGELNACAHGLAVGVKHLRGTLFVHEGAREGVGLARFEVGVGHRVREREGLRRVCHVQAGGSVGQCGSDAGLVDYPDALCLARHVVMARVQLAPCVIDPLTCHDALPGKPAQIAVDTNLIGSAALEFEFRARAQHVTSRILQHIACLVTQLELRDVRAGLEVLIRPRIDKSLVAQRIGGLRPVATE